MHKEELERLANIFSNFFNDPDVGKELAVLLKGKPFDREELSYLFQQTCFDIDILPDVDFDRTITAFEAAFLTAAADEPDLQRVIQAKQLWALPERETLEIIRELVKFLRQVDILDIRNGKITAQSKADGKQVSYQLPNVGISLTEENWEEYYLRALIRQCDPLDLTPLNETHPQGVQRDEVNIVSVSEVFVPLYLAHLTRSAEETVATIIRQKNASSLSPKIEGEEKRWPIQAVEAVAATPRLVILGQRGGGKSTLVNYITTQLARRRLGEQVSVDKLPGWPENETSMPVCTMLRRFANWLPTDVPDEMSDLVWNCIEKQMEQWGCKQAFPFLKQQLMKEGGIIFFDGLDEVHETNESSKRALVNKAIAAFAALQEKFQIVITCRKYAYDKDKANHVWPLSENDFPVVELALFNLRQIKAFTQCWCQAVGPQRGWNQQKCHDEATKLYQTIDNWPNLHELAQLPLLLTFISQLHCRHGNLPENIAELCERAFVLLTEQWENRIVVERSGAAKVESGVIMELGISTKKLRSSLEHVAFVALEHQKEALQPLAPKTVGESHDQNEKSQAWSHISFPQQDMVEKLTNDSGSMYEARRCIAFLQERVELLFLAGVQYGFNYRVIQEYLAAGHILERPQHKALMNSLIVDSPARWGNVERFANAKFKWDAMMASDGGSTTFNEQDTGLVEFPDKKKRRDQIKSEESVLSLFAIARVDLEPAKREEEEWAFVGKTYSVYAGFSSEQLEDFAAEPFELSVSDKAKFVPFDILIHTSRNIELTTDWYKRLDYKPYNSDSQLAEFTFKAITQGRCFLILDFYYERRWLRTIQFDFDSVAAS